MAVGAAASTEAPEPKRTRWMLLQVDVEDRSVTLQGDETTVRSVLDTLTCSCMQ